MQTLKKVVEVRGLKGSAGLLSVTPQRLSNWMKRGVPVAHCATVEAKLGVSRKVLRPDDWHLIWPEFSTAPAQFPSPAAIAQEVSHG